MRALQIRGTNGTGKTTIVRQLLEESKAIPIAHCLKKVRIYQGELYDLPFYVLGSYETTCGGCDTIPSVNFVADLIEQVMGRNHPGLLVFEGLMISHMLGTVGAAQVRTALHRHILGFLDTPLEVCIERVKARRVERGDLRPFNPKNVIADYGRVELSRKNAERRAYRVRTIHWQNPMTVVHHLLQDLAYESRKDYE